MSDLGPVYPLAWLILGAFAAWVIYLFATRSGLRRLGLALGILAFIGLLVVLWAVITVITG